MNSSNDCWHNDCYQEMLNGANGKMWPVLEKSGHWPVLEEFLQHVINQYKVKPSLLDLGCGAGALSKTKIVKDKFSYMGADLPLILENVAAVFCPDGNFIDCDVYSNVDIVAPFDVVLMNGLIDIMEHPVRVLENVLEKCTNYVIIHRQWITQKPSYTEEHNSYGGDTFISHINELEFNNITRHFEVTKEKSGLGDTNYSFLLKRRR